ncbi:MAG TPA: hypothetical protein VF579_00910 [Candidatus Methylomirabilis sp.]
MRLRLLQDFRSRPQVISRVMVLAAGGRLVRLHSVTELSAGKTPGRASMATVVIGGQMLVLLLTLVATPVYSLLDDLRTPAWLSAWLGRLAGGWSRIGSGRRSGDR